MKLLLAGFLGMLISAAGFCSFVAAVAVLRRTRISEKCRGAADDSY